MTENPYNKELSLWGSDMHAAWEEGRIAGAADQADAIPGLYDLVVANDEQGRLIEELVKACKSAEFVLHNSSTGSIGPNIAAELREAITKAEPEH